MSATLTPSSQTNPPETDLPRPAAADSAMTAAREGDISTSSIGNLQRIGGIAALIGASTNLLALVMFAILAPKGYGSDRPAQAVAFFADNQDVMRVLYGIQYLVFGVSLIFLSLALYERLNAGAPVLTQAVTTFGLIWAFLVIVIGTLSLNDLSTIVKLHGENPAQAATVWSALNSVETGLGGGGGETVVSSLWFLLLSWAALRVRALPRMLNHLGVVVGVAGVISVVLALLGLMVVYGLGLIIWLVWLGTVMLRRSPIPAGQLDGKS